MLALTCQVDAMKLGLKEMKKEYKKVNIDEIEVLYVHYMFPLISTRTPAWDSNEVLMHVAGQEYSPIHIHEMCLSPKVYFHDQEHVPDQRIPS